MIKCSGSGTERVGADAIGAKQLRKGDQHVDAKDEDSTPCANRCAPQLPDYADAGTSRYS
jgi:hypothetical protein